MFDFTVEPDVRCERHLDEPLPNPCSACGDARRHHEAWTRAKRIRDQEQASAAARLHAAQTRYSTSTCPLCDERGYMPSGRVCHHDPHRSETNAKGLAACRAELDASNARLRGEDTPTRETP